MVHRPIYMKQSHGTIAMPTNVIEKSPAGDITTESVYDMPDALEEPRKKPIFNISTKTGKRKKGQQKKPTRKPCKKERPGKISIT